MAAINFPPNDTPSTVRTLYTISAPWTDPVNGGEWWFSSTKVRWMPVVAGGGASGFGDLGGVPADNTALADALALKAPLASPTFTGTVTASGAVNAGARVTATRGTVGVGTVYTDGSLAAIAGTSTDFLSRFVVGDLITFNTTVVGETGPETRMITAIHSDTSMTTLPFSGPAASSAEAYTHTTASAVMNPSGAITGRTGTFSGAVSGTTGFFTGTVTAGGANNWTGSTFSGAQAFTGAVSVTDATASTTTTTGALKVAGGLGVVGAINAAAITGTTGTFSGVVTGASFNINTNGRLTYAASGFRYGPTLTSNSASAYAYHAAYGFVDSGFLSGFGNIGFANMGFTNSASQGVAWTSGATVGLGALDTGIFRKSGSPGTVQIGSGAIGSKAGSLELTNLTASGTVKAGGYTVATLPTPAVGMSCYVTDATATTFYSIVAGGGSNVVPVFYNGTNWVIA